MEWNVNGMAGWLAGILDLNAIDLELGAASVEGELRESRHRGMAVVRV